MFKQDVTTTYNLEDATYEVVIMLLVAFFLGYLLRYFLIRKPTPVEVTNESPSQLFQLTKTQKELEHCINEKAEQKKLLSLEFGLKIEDLKSKLTVAQVDLEHCQAAKNAILSHQGNQDIEELKKSIRLEYLTEIEDLKSKLTVARVDLEHSLAAKEAILSHHDNQDVEELKKSISLEYLTEIEDLKSKLTVARVDLEHSLAAKEAILSHQDNQDVEELKKSIRLEYLTEMEDLKSKLTVARVDLEHCMSAKASLLSHQNPSEKAIEPSTPNDLKIIEGIGPALAKLLNLADINTFEELANTKEETLRQILSNAGSRFKVHDPSTWPEQARLAANQSWEELKQYQEKLNS